MLASVEDDEEEANTGAIENIAAAPIASAAPVAITLLIKVPFLVE